MDIVRRKEYPQDQPSDARRILEALTVDPQEFLILGSIALRSQQQAGDYDCFQNVRLSGSEEHAVNEGVDALQTVVRKIQTLDNVYFGDIKCGEIEDFNVLGNAKVENGKVVGQDSNRSVERLEALLDEGAITESEQEKGVELLVKDPDVEEFLTAKNLLRFGVVRWKPKEILEGVVQWRGREVTLGDAISSPSRTKIDVVGWVQNNRFTDFSCIYEFHWNGKVLNPVKVPIQASLEEDILGLASEGEWFKVLKRQFSLARFQKRRDEIERLNGLLNSDLGRLYQVVSDLATLGELLRVHDVPLRQVRLEIDQFRGRLSNIYRLRDYLRDEDRIARKITDALNAPRSRLVAHLSSLQEELSRILNSTAKKFVKTRQRAL